MKIKFRVHFCRLWFPHKLISTQLLKSILPLMSVLIGSAFRNKGKTSQYFFKHFTSVLIYVLLYWHYTWALHCLVFKFPFPTSFDFFPFALQGKCYAENTFFVLLFINIIGIRQIPIKKKDQICLKVKIYIYYPTV